MKNSKILRVLLITALLLACGSSGVPAGAEMVTKYQFDNFDRTLKRDYQTSFFARCHSYTVTDRDGNNLLTVTERPVESIYTFDDDKMLFFHRNYTGTGSKYPDFTYLYDIDSYVIDVKENGLFCICPDSMTSYVINAVAGMKIICDGYHFILTNTETSSCQLELTRHLGKGKHDFIHFYVNIGTEGSIFSIRSGVLTYALGYEQELDITVKTPTQYGHVYTSERNGILDINTYSSGSDIEKNLTWKKSAKAKRYVIWQKTEDGFVKTGKTKETNYLVKISKDTLFLIKAQRKIKGKWKTIRTSTVVAKME